MKILAVDEFNARGHLIYAANFPGAFVRGACREEALAKFPAEMNSYAAWAQIPCDGHWEIGIVQEKPTELNVCDADSDVLFDSERAPLAYNEYIALKALALRSAASFQELYDSVPDKSATCLAPRKTFYGDVPRSAEEMYRHTMSVNSYYFAELDVAAENGPDILSCRERGFALLEQQPDYLQNAVRDGDYDERWSLRKLLRRFLWHDRIHAKAMYRQAVLLFDPAEISDTFCFRTK